MRGVWNWIVTRTADYGLPKQIELIDIVQILLIAFFVYHLIRWLQNTKAYTLMKGIFLIGVFVIIANVLKMQTILWLFGNIGGAEEWSSRLEKRIRCLPFLLRAARRKMNGSVTKPSMNW